MRIRTQLAVAFLLLAVVPLAGIVLYSYYSSLRAVRRATDSQARVMAGEMEARMASIKGELGRGVERIGDVPAGDLLAAARSHREGPADTVLSQVMRNFGPAAPFVRGLEFIPAPAAQPSPNGATAPPQPIPKIVIDVPGILRDARRQAEAAQGANPLGLAAIDTALEALTSSGEAPPSPSEAPPAPGLATAIREQVRQQLAAQAEERRQAMADMRADMRKAQREQAAVARQQAAAERLVLGRTFEAPVRQQGKVVGKVKVQVRGDELLRRVLARTRSAEGEIPFAVDAEGKLHTIDAGDRKKIEMLHLPLAKLGAGAGRFVLRDWVVATRKDAESGLVFGIARPVPLAEVRQAAARNFGYGLGMIGLALVGILPLSTRMTRNLKLVTEGADRIAHGDLDARVPVRSRNEFGKLALTFNRMAADLKQHQDRLLEEERLRQEREIEQALLQTEYERKTRELEEARRFQLSLLPKALPEHPAFEIAVSMRTATEVGG